MVNKRSLFFLFLIQEFKENLFVTLGLMSLILIRVSYISADTFDKGPNLGVRGERLNSSHPL